MSSRVYSFSEFYDDKLALAGGMILIGFLGITFGRMLNHSEEWRSIHDTCEHLRRKRITNMRFDGEISITLSKGTSVAFVSMHWVLFTLQSLKEHLYENAIDVFSVIYLAQICGLILLIPHSGDEHIWKDVLTGHLPAIEIAMVVVFIYVMWRTGLHWGKMISWFHPVILDRINEEMR